MNLIGFTAILTCATGDLDSFKADYMQFKNDSTLKSAKIEKELNDYKATMQQVNINQEPKQKVSGYGTVSLPKNAANGQISVIVKGLTATNLLAHDRFEGRTSEYTVQDLGDRFRCINDGAADRYNYFSNTGQNISIGDKVYIRAKFLVNTNGNGFRSLTWHPAVGFVPSADREVFTDYEENTVYEVSVVLTATDNRDRIYFTFQVPAGSTNGHYWDIYKDCIAINLTKTFGAGNEPTKEECDRIFANWFNGTKSTISAMRLKSVSADETETSTAYVVAKDEEGKIAELRSLPNGTKDEICVTEGKHTKRVSDPVSISNTMYASIDKTTYVNVDVVKTTAFSAAMAGTTGKDGTTKLYDKNGVELTEVAQTDIDNTASIGKYYWHTDKTLWIIVTKGAYADITAARTALGTMTLNYQLAEPIEIPVQVSGSIVSYPNGTIYIERILPDAGVYTDKITILHQGAPIKRLDRLSKVDFYTGVETELDVSEAVIAEDKLSFTHPDLSEGDIVFFEYEYDVESTEGETEVEYYDSRYVVKDDVTGKFYKWNVKVSNGTPTIEVVEV